MKKIIRTLMALFILTVSLSVTFTSASYAINPLSSACSSDSGSTLCSNQGDSVQTIVTRVVDTLLFIVGVISVIAIIVGGIMYATSGGEAAAVAKAKNVIFYAIIGLVVAFLSYAIANWVMSVVGTGNTTV